MAYNIPASKEQVERTSSALQTKGYDVTVVADKTQALEQIKTIIPKGASIMSGSSTTLEQIGFLHYLETGDHGWINFHAEVIAENDPVKRAELRKKAVTSDFYLGSVHALAPTGEFLVASNSGSQLPHIAFTSQNLIFIVGTQKIVPTLVDGMKRLEEYVIHLEDERMKKAYGVGTHDNKILIFKGESPNAKRRIHFILIEKVLGF